MNRSTKDGAPREKPPWRLRIPASLAVAVVGTSATIAMSFGGCQETKPDPVDAGPIDRIRDAGADAVGELDDGSTGGFADAGVETPDAPRDAAMPPPDAPVG